MAGRKPPIGRLAYPDFNPKFTNEIWNSGLKVILSSLTFSERYRMVLSKTKCATGILKEKTSGGYAMKTEIGCACRHGVPRREVLQGSLAAAVTAVGGVTDALATPAAKTGVRTIDVHAHYYPQAYFDLFNTEDRR